MLFIFAVISAVTVMVMYLNRDPKFSVSGRDTHTYVNSREVVEREYVEVSSADGFGDKQESVEITKLHSNGKQP